MNKVNKERPQLGVSPSVDSRSKKQTTARIKLLEMKYVLPFIIVVAILLTLTFFGLSYYQKKQSALYVEQYNSNSLNQSRASLTQYEEQPNFNNTNQIVLSPIISPLPTKLSTKELKKLDVKYLKKEKILEDSVIHDQDNNTDATFTFYRIGTITSGKYKNGDLILASVTFAGPCKSDSCDEPERYRYIKKDNQAIFLPNISYPNNLSRFDREVNPFEKFGLSLVTDDSVTIPFLEYPLEIMGNKARQILKFSGEEEGKVDLGKIVSVSNHEVFGEIYTTKPELSPSKSFFYQWSELPGVDSISGCSDSGCFTTNAFFVFRPDGTFLTYAYHPPFEIKDFIWQDPLQNGSLYDFRTRASCSGDAIDYNSVISPTIVRDSDLEAVASLSTTGDTIYQLRNKNLQLYQEFHQNYVSNFVDWSQYDNPRPNPKSYEEFINAHPILIWHDPFGRLIRFNNKDFIPPFSCEPIIYLYPEKSQTINVKVQPKGLITTANPSYSNGWTVVADPQGRLRNLSDNKIYPYLFWEGWSSIFPLQEHGFVVAQSHVEQFFNDILPRLGLNEVETKDFITAWLPNFAEAPYYFITFLDHNFIDKLAPLTVSPRPDTVIRVLMDFKPLEEPIVVPKLTLPDIPERTGFTLVEWGGLKR